MFETDPLMAIITLCLLSADSWACQLAGLVLFGCWILTCLGRL